MHYVIYASKRRESTTVDDIDQIIITSERNNQKADISGVLLIKQDFFLQYFEGPESEVRHLLDTLGHDSRHYDVKILDRGMINDRVFPDWKMMPIHNSIDHQDCLARINNIAIPHLKQLLIRYFVNESPVSIAYGEMPY